VDKYSTVRGVSGQVMTDKIQYSAIEIQQLNIDKPANPRYTFSAIKSIRSVELIIHATL
jgi:hypothetical protein